MKVYVNTTEIVANAKALSSLNRVLTAENSKIKNIMYSLQEQSVPIENLNHALHTIYEIENELDFLVCQLEKIGNIYDDTEAEVLEKIQLLYGDESVQNDSPSIVLYKVNDANDATISRGYSAYMKLLSQVPYSATHGSTSFRRLFVKKNIREISKVMNQVFNMPGEAIEEWLLEKMIHWLSDNEEIPSRMDEINVTELF